MPIDPNVLTPTLIKPISVAGVVHDAAVVQEAQARAQAYRDKQMELARDRQQRDQIAGIIRENGGDIEKSYQQVVAVNPDYANDLMESHLKSQKLQNEIQNMDFEKRLKVNDSMAQELAAVETAPDDQRQYRYDLARAHIQASRKILGMPPATDQELDPVYDSVRVHGYMETSQKMATLLGHQAESKLGWYQLPDDPTPHLMKETKDGRVVWKGQDVSEQVQPVEKKATTDGAKVGTFEDYVVRTYGPNPTPAQILAARKAYGQADDRAVRVSVNAGGTAAGGLSTGEGGGLELAGTWARLGQRVPIGLTRGANPVAIANEAARQNKLLGRTPVQAMLKSAMLKSDQKALDQITKSAAGAEAYESKALAQLDIVDGLSDKVWRTKSPMVNAAINAGQTQILGDDDAQLLLNAILTASTEYAKIMSGGTGSAAASSDSAQAEAKKLLHMGMGQGTLKKATALMRQEMALTMNGYDVAKQHINENMNSAAGGQTPAVADPLTVVAPNGKTYKFTTPEKAAAFKKAAGIQ